MGYKARSASKKSLISAILLIFVLLLSGCGSESSSEFFAMDTVMSVKTYGRNSEDAVKAVEDEIMRLDRLFSIGNESSDISKLNSSGRCSVSDETALLVGDALKYGSYTSGLFDISISPVSEAWGFYSDSQSVPSEKTISRLLGLVDYNDVVLNGNEISFAKEGMAIDLGGIAKGYASLKVADIIRSSGCRSAIISLGGNVAAVGKNPNGQKWIVAVRDPFDASAYYGYLELADSFAVTSGAYQRYFEEDGVVYHHIIDPRTGYPSLSDLSSVTVVSSDPVLADAYSTALFIMGSDGAIGFWQSSTEKFDLCLICSDGSLIITDGLRDSFRSQYSFEVVSR